ncbi:twin-arginine translocase TatA/TatE family subunit [Alphaproteobacteria bacterium]|jgi:sec-independent protein translocase protein TatA|nr:twin-arginine translocase TatA/TatE family subunit [Alphaproteobacteria bacterium]|tara:strand:+ start:310 stop:543 length:234 start_codon:yes stop_codon:yes gene_type:complete
MGFTSIWHWLVVLVIVLVLFGGRGKISSIMGDIGKGLKNFKKGMKDEDNEVLDGEKKTSDNILEVVDVSRKPSKEKG